MMLHFGKRIGQSGYELTLAVFFSFFIHAAIVTAALFIYFAASPRMSVRPIYSVKLVSLPTEIPPTPVQQNIPFSPPTPREERKTEPQRTKKEIFKAARTVEKRSAVPEFSEQEQKAKPIPLPEENKPAEPSVEQKQNSAVKTESAPGSTPVAVSTPQEESKYEWLNFYVDRVRGKIAQNWRPPPDSKDAKARVIFSINRSGWLLSVDIEPSQTNGSTIFFQAAIRAIQLSNPFPQLPDDFEKQTLEFSVDLTTK